MGILFIFKVCSEKECIGNRRDLDFKRGTKLQPYKIKEKKNSHLWSTEIKLNLSSHTVITMIWSICHHTMVWLYR